MTTPIVLFMAVLGFLAAGLVLLYQAASAVVWCASQVLGAGAKLIRHSLGFIKIEVLEGVQTAGALLSCVAITPLALGNLLIGRWSSAKHYGRALSEEGFSSLSGLYRFALANPLRLLGLGAVVNRVEGRLPELVNRSPRHEPRRRPRPMVEPPPLRRNPVPRGPQPENQFEGYEVVGELPAGGSGARLFLARPTRETVEQLARAELTTSSQVVIKSFAIAAGSTLPQIVREGRALESARRLGLVYQHSLDEERFWYVMPYVRGRELGAVSTSLHARSGSQGLDAHALRQVASYTNDVLASLTRFHEDGLWHKDVKPSNVVVADEVAHLIDLGLVTPLASAMTLTTHGTEYYRDPELVRQALRGAKVNEVDGVKFDLYAVGALLYSMIENSFPAHGSLSRITKRCPEALAFIQRRAMADLSDRYSSAAEMSADLALLLSARDPFTVLPAQLPSFQRAMTEAGESHVDRSKHQRSSGSRILRAGAPSPKKSHRNGAAAQAAAVASATGGVATLAPEPRQRRRGRQGVATFGLMFLAVLAVTKIIPTIIYNTQSRNGNQTRTARASATASGQVTSNAQIAATEELDQKAWEDSAKALAEAERDQAEVVAAHWRRALAELAQPGAAARLEAAGQSSNVLVLSDLHQGTEHLPFDSLATVLEASGFGVLGTTVKRAETEQSIELEAEARHSLGLANEASEQAIANLRSYLDRTPQVGAVVWITEDAQPQESEIGAKCVLVLPNGVSMDKKTPELLSEQNGFRIVPQPRADSTIVFYGDGK